MTPEQKKEHLQSLLTDAQLLEYRMWTNWQIALSQVERLVKLLSSLDGS